MDRFIYKKKKSDSQSLPQSEDYSLLILDF